MLSMCRFSYLSTERQPKPRFHAEPRLHFAEPFLSNTRLKVKGECMKFRQSSDIINSKVPLVDNRIDNNPYENQLVFYIYCKIEKKENNQ